MKTNTMAQTLRCMLLKLSGVIVNNIGIGVITACIVFFASEAKGQVRPQAIGPPPPVQIFPWGSSNALTQFAVTNTQYIRVAVYQGNNGNEAQWPPGAYIASFSDMASVNYEFQQVLITAGNQAISNSTIVKGNPIMAGGVAKNDTYPPTIGCAMFQAVNGGFSFSLVYTNGTWTLPNLSGASMALMPLLPFYIPSLEWGRIEVYSITNLASPFLVVDSRYPASSSVTNSVDTNNQAITIATPYLASGNTGPYRLKVSMLTDTGFLIVDGNGVKVAETPFSIQNFSVQNGVASLNVAGGDTGTVFVVQHSPDLINWVTVGGPYTAVTGSTVYFQEPVITLSVNTPMTIRNFTVSNQTVHFNVMGGETNTVFTVEKSQVLGNWKSMGAPVYPTNNLTSIPFSDTASSSAGFYRTRIMQQMFFRTVTTNIVPQ
jgi:hypothetical protein